MPNTALQILRHALAGNVPLRHEFLWQDLFAAMVSVTSSAPTSHVERLLLDILRFDGKLQLTPNSEMPHSMTPEEMLKSLALQALGRWTGLTYLREMQRVQATAVSPALVSTARAVIQRARLATPRENEWETIREIFAEEQPGEGSRSPHVIQKVTGHMIARDRGMTYLTDQQICTEQLAHASYL
jgi:hypothetical protein